MKSRYSAAAGMIFAATMTLTITALRAETHVKFPGTPEQVVAACDALGDGAELIEGTDGNGNAFASCHNGDKNTTVTCDSTGECQGTVPRPVGPRFTMGQLLAQPPVGGQTNSRPRNQPAPASLSESVTSTDVGPTVGTPPFDPGPSGPAFPDGPATP
jgi:hypothetical protein